MPREPHQEAAEAARKAAAKGAGIPAAPHRQVDPGIEIPTDQHDPPAGLEHRLLHEREVVFGVDDHARAIDFRESPDTGFRGSVVRM